MLEVPTCNWISLVAPLLAACAYQPGTFAYWNHGFPGARASFGCVDFAISRRIDDPHKPVVLYEFGNRCDHVVPLDLAAISVSGRTADGRELTLRPYDPRGEIRVLPLDGRVFGAEAIEYYSEDPALALASVCVDAAPAFDVGVSHRTCFASAQVAGEP